MASVAKGSFPPRAVAISVVLALLAASITVGQVKVAELLAAAVLGYVFARAFKELLSHWSWLIYGLAAINLLIPEDDRYTLHGTGGAGFELEPYRVILTVMILAWIAALMIDPEVRFRKTKFDGPLALIFVAIAGSEIFNAARVSSLSSFVTKALFLVLCLLALLYILASVIRSRETIDRILKVIVCCGCVVAVGAAIQNATTFNIFNHIHGLLPIFTFNSAAGGGAILRNGHFRALASAGTSDRACERDGDVDADCGVSRDSRAQTVGVCDSHPACGQSLVRIAHRHHRPHCGDSSCSYGCARVRLSDAGRR